MPSGTQSAMASAQPINQPSHRGAPVPQNAQQALSPPSKEQLKSWWRVLGRGKKDKEDEKAPAPRGIFNVPLSESILYANVAISLTNEEGESFIYGYVPIIVAKCGVFLKEKATDVEGIFRLSGSAKRIKDLQTIFNSPDRYGKGLDWTGYTVHDAANILRRYLNLLPEPIVPLDFYERFRDPLRAYQAKAGNGAQHQVMENQEHAVAVHAYQALIKELPALNRQLLLYILDLLAVFASKSDMNRMTAQNLAAIFQPGIISHPEHDMAPNEYRLSQDVLIFLIENQDNFLIGMNGTAMDEKTKDEVKSGPPSIKTPKATNIGRSASTASAGADSLRRTGGLRRGGSTSSRNSRERSSPGVSNPGTPGSPSAFTGSAGNTNSLTRSNTVPSRSPAMTGSRFQRVSENSPPTTPTATTPAPVASSPLDNAAPNDVEGASTVPTTEFGSTDIQPENIGNKLAEQPGSTEIAPQENNSGLNALSIAPVNGKQSKDRKLANFFPKSPIFGPSDQQLSQQQQPSKPRNKLQKRRIPGSISDSAQSSQASLNNGEEGSVFQTPALTPNALNQDRIDPMEVHGQVANIVSSPTTEHMPNAQLATSPPSREARNPSRGLMPPGSPTPSIHSRGSGTDPSDLDALDDPAAREEKKRRRFRLSSAWKGDDNAPLAPPPVIGQNAGARNSNSSLGSHVPRKSFTGDSQITQTSAADNSSAGNPSAFLVSSRESADPLKDPYAEPAKKENVFSKWKAKLSGKGDADRAKSPPRQHPDQTTSRNSLSAIAHDFAQRGRSFDRPRDDPLPIVQEKPMAEKVQAHRPSQPSIQIQQPNTRQNQGPMLYPSSQESYPLSAPATAMPKPFQMQSQLPPQSAQPPAVPVGSVFTPPESTVKNIPSETVPITGYGSTTAPPVVSDPVAETSAIATANVDTPAAPHSETQEATKIDIPYRPATVPENAIGEGSQQQPATTHEIAQNSGMTSQPTVSALEEQNGQHT